jgi:hypothetical protein
MSGASPLTTFITRRYVLKGTSFLQNPFIGVKILAASLIGQLLVEVLASKHSQDLNTARTQGAP